MNMFEEQENNYQQLTEEVVSGINNKLSEFIRNAGLNRRWLRTNELAEYLHLSESQISTLKAKGEISCRKLGGTNYYDKQEIDNMLKNQKV